MPKKPLPFVMAHKISFHKNEYMERTQNKVEKNQKGKFQPKKH